MQVRSSPRTDFRTCHARILRKTPRLMCRCFDSVSQQAPAWYGIDQLVPHRPCRMQGMFWRIASLHGGGLSYRLSSRCQPYQLVLIQAMRGFASFDVLMRGTTERRSNHRVHQSSRRRYARGAICRSAGVEGEMDSVRLSLSHSGSEPPRNSLLQVTQSSSGRA